MGMPENTYYGKLGEAIAWAIKPEMVKAGPEDDKNGTDFFWFEHPEDKIPWRVQVKGDKHIVNSGRLYWELTEKSYPKQPFRNSPKPIGNLSRWMFVTDGSYVELTTEQLSWMIKDEKVIQCTSNGTSIGIYIPKHKWAQHQRPHTMWIPWHKGIEEVRINPPDAPPWTPPGPPEQLDMINIGWGEVK